MKWLPSLLRPLAGHDKQEIIDHAIDIGTYDISVEPYDDCCSLFVPKNPETSAKLDKLRADEAKIDVDGLIKQALKEVEIRNFALHPKEDE